MKGNGIGSIFSGLMRSALPMLKRGAMSAGKKLLSGGLESSRMLCLKRILLNPQRVDLKPLGEIFWVMQNLRYCKNLEEGKVKVENETPPQQ